MKKVANEKFEKKFANKVKAENIQKEKNRERFNNNVKPFLVVPDEKDENSHKGIKNKDYHNFKTILIILAIIAAFFVGLEFGTSGNLMELFTKL